MSGATATGAPSGLRWLQRQRPSERQPGPDLERPYRVAHFRNAESGTLGKMRRARRAAGIHNRSFAEGGRSSSGWIPWYVPEGAEFDAEQAHGYRPVRSPFGGDDAWALIPHAVPGLTERELTWADPDPDELEDWDLGPMRRPDRQLRGIWTDYAALFIPDEEVEALIAEAEASLDGAGNPFDHRTVEGQRLVREYRRTGVMPVYGEGPEPEVAEAPKKTRKRAAKRTPARPRPSAPSPDNMGLPTN